MTDLMERVTLTERFRKVTLGTVTGIEDTPEKQEERP